MPLRMLEYVSLQLGERQRGGQGLPPVLPIVLHTGHSRWTAPVSFEPQWPRLVIPEHLAPRAGYHFVCAGDWPLPEDPKDLNLITEVFRCMQSFDGTDVTRLLDGLMMVAERGNERWVLDALADPLGRLIARRYGKTLPPEPVATMQSLKEEMETWLFMPAPGEWQEMLDEERRLRQQAQELRQQAQELRQQEQERLQQEQERHCETLRRAITRLDPEAAPERLARLTVEELQKWFDRL